MKTIPPRSVLFLILAAGCTGLFFFYYQPNPNSVSLPSPTRSPVVTSVPTPKPPEIDPQAIHDFQTWAANFDKNSTLAQGVELAKERKLAMLELIKNDPKAALESTLPYSIRSKLPEEITQHLEKRVSGKGNLDVIAALPNSDPEAAQLEIITRVVSLDGEQYDAYVYGRRLDQTAKRGISLNGIVLGNRMAVNESPLRVLEKGEPIPKSNSVANDGNCPVSQTTGAGPVVEVAKLIYYLCDGAHIVPLEQNLIAAEGEGPHADAGGSGGSGGEIAPASARSEGPKDVLYIRVDFSDLPGEPMTEAFAQNMIDVTVNNYYVQQSYDKTSMKTVVTPVVRLPKTKEYYSTNSTSYYTLMSDARAAAKALGSTYDTANYDLDIIAFAKVYSGWSGRGYVGSKGSWLNGSFTFRTTAHELGHNYGVRHANFWNTTDGNPISTSGTNVEYGNPFDVMGGGSSEPYHFNAWFKYGLNWLTSNQVKTVTSSGTYRIYAFDYPLTTQVGALKIVKDTSKSYWLEFRQRQTISSWLMNGASVNWGFASVSSTGSQLLDLTAGSAGAKSDSPLVIGRTFSDTAAGVHMTAIGKGGTSPESLDVTVNIGSFPGNGAPIIENLTASATTVSANTLVDFSVNASDPNGDTLAYYWEFGENVFASSNATTAQKAWTSNGTFVVKCEVSDMKGGKTTQSVSVSVTAPTVWAISGTATWSGGPLSDVTISDGTRTTKTDIAGKYTLWGVPNGTYTVTASKAGYTFLPKTIIISSASKTSQNFSGLVGSGDTTAPTLAVTSPANFSYVTNNSVTLVGTSSDASGILSVKVNGTTASTSNGFTNWSSTTSSLVPGTNSFSVVATDKASPANTKTVNHYVLFASGSFDANKDGIGDAWQIQYFGFGFAISPSASSDSDPDGDRMTNAQEYAANTNPLDRKSHLKITSQTTSPTGDSVTLNWDSVSGKIYTIEYSSDLITWIPVSSPVPASSSSTSWIDNGSLTGGSPSAKTKCYYRVKTSAP